MRAERLCALTPGDWQQLAASGLTTICDLRSATERLRHPNCIPPELPLSELRFDVRNDIREDESLVARLAENPTEDGAERMMAALYERFPELLAPTLRKLCEQLLARRAPLLIHCTAGKDRTGFTVAVLLYALGIPRELVYADYLASRNWAGAKMHRPALARRLAPVIPAAAIDTVLNPILDVRELYLDAALAAAAAEFSSVERYFEHATGLDRREIDHLRDLALV